MSKKKILTIAICVALVAALVVGASIAYFTDTTQTEQNVFTIGNVDISLAEPNWDPDDAKLMPGTYVDKDPTVTVARNSEDCWLFVELELSRYVPMFQYLGNTVAGFADKTPIEKSIALTNAFLVGFENANWKVMNPEVMNTQPDATGAWPGTINIILGYQVEALSAGDEVVVFTKAGLPNDLDQTNASLFFYYADGTPKEGPNEIHLNITAKAIQAEGISDIDAAYAAMYPTT